MKAGGFWTPGVTPSFDVRVTHVNSRSNQCKHTVTIFKEQENKKKTIYSQGVGIWYKRGQGTRLSEIFKNSRK